MRWHSALKIGRIWMPSAENCAAFTTGPGMRLIDQWKREHSGSSISFVWLYLPVSLLSECIFVESPIYCESRSCYALDALFSSFFFFKNTFSRSQACSPEILLSVHLFLLRFHSRKWYNARVNYCSSSRVCASTVELADECSAMSCGKRRFFYRCSNTSDERMWRKIG